MIHRYNVYYLCSSRNSIKQVFSRNPCQNYSPYSKIYSNYTPSALDFPCYLHQINNTSNPKKLSTQIQIGSNSYKYTHLSFYCSYSSGAFRSFKKRARKRLKANAKPCLNEAQFHQAISELLPRFSAGELCEVLNLQEDPIVCLEIFNWASQQPRFRHDVSTYHIIIKKLGTTKLKLTRAAIIFKHMRSCSNLDCRPSIRTYNLLFAAFLSRRSDSYINHMYMATIRCLFKQMVNDGIEPDVFSLNSMIEGYVLSLHLCNEMKGKGFVPSSKSYNSLVNALALCGEVDEAVNYLWEMTEKQRSADFITYQTVLDQICRQGRTQDAMSLLKELQVKDLLDGHTYQKLLSLLEQEAKNEADMVAVGWKAKDPTAQRETLSALGNPSHFKARVTSRKLSLSQLAFSLPLLEGERDFLFFYQLLGQISLFLCLLKISVFLLKIHNG
ncbi:unnamed protein product, partial [Vitis vinifera]